MNRWTATLLGSHAALQASGCSLVLGDFAAGDAAPARDSADEAAPPLDGGTSSRDGSGSDARTTTDAGGGDANSADGTMSDAAGDGARDATISDAAASDADGGSSADASDAAPDAPPPDHCTIDGGAWGANYADPSNVCLSCQPLRSATAWSPAREGFSCNGPGTCRNGSCQFPQSCSGGGPGVSTCGDAGTESCCASLPVYSGAYDRSYSNDDAGSVIDGSAADPASVTGFRLDKYLVTVGRFRQFVNAWDGGVGFTPSVSSGVHTHLNGGSGLVNSGDAGGFEPGWAQGDEANVAPTTAELLTHCNAAGSGSYATWTESADGGQENLPINCIHWQEAYAFCIWDGAFLPSEAEWEFAAGGAGQQSYPWGNAPPDLAHAVTYCAHNAAGTCTGVTNIAPVGSAALGRGQFGQMDLAGELREWTLDWYGQVYGNPCSDCADTSPNQYAARVVRGGSFRLAVSQTYYLHPSSRDVAGPTSRYDDVGFRCARTP